MFTPRFNRQYSYFIVAFALVVCIISSATPHRSHAAASTTEKTVAQPSAAAQREGAREEYGNITLVFEENSGQSDQRAKFLSHASHSILFLTDSPSFNHYGHPA